MVKMFWEICRSMDEGLLMFNIKHVIIKIRLAIGKIIEYPLFQSLEISFQLLRNLILNLIYIDSNCINWTEKKRVDSYQQAFGVKTIFLDGRIIVDIYKPKIVSDVCGYRLNDAISIHF